MNKQPLPIATTPHISMRNRCHVKSTPLPSIRISSSNMQTQSQTGISEPQDQFATPPAPSHRSRETAEETPEKSILAHVALRRHAIWSRGDSPLGHYSCTAESSGFSREQGSPAYSTAASAYSVTPCSSLRDIRELHEPKDHSTVSPLDLSARFAASPSELSLSGDGIESPLLENELANLDPNSKLSVDGIKSQRAASDNKASSSVDPEKRLSFEHRLSRKNSLCVTKMLTLDKPLTTQPVGNTSGFANLDVDLSIERLLGEGRFSQVFLARAQGSGDQYALKRSKSRLRSRSDRARCLSEVQIYKSMPWSPFIVEYYSAWQDQGYFYAQMEFCRYGNLEELRLSVKCLPSAATWIPIEHIAAALAHMHSFGFVHLDVKPANVLVSEQGVCKLGDLGLACVAGDGHDTNEGDSRYIAPEILSSSERNPPADVFSLGLTVLFLNTGSEMPSNGEEWHRLRSGRFDHCGQFSPVLHKMLQKYPGERPQAEEVRQICEEHRTHEGEALWKRLYTG